MSVSISSFTSLFDRPFMPYLRIFHLYNDNQYYGGKILGSAQGLFMTIHWLL